MAAALNAAATLQTTPTAFFGLQKVNPMPTAEICLLRTSTQNTHSLLKHFATKVIISASILLHAFPKHKLAKLAYKFGSPTPDKVYPWVN